MKNVFTALSAAFALCLAASPAVAKEEKDPNKLFAMLTDNWFVLGVGLGWLACWWRLGRRGARAPASPWHETAPAVASVDAAEPIVEPREPLPEIPASRMIDVSAARAAGFNMRHASDLTIIEGIGPKISDLLHANGIESFTQIAQLHVDAMLDLLQRGGPSFRLADPATWGQQASLAAQNRWADLKRFQNELLDGESNPAP